MGEGGLNEEAGQGFTHCVILAVDGLYCEHREDVTLREIQINWLDYNSRTPHATGGRDNIGGASPLLSVIIMAFDIITTIPCFDS